MNTRDRLTIPSDTLAIRNLEEWSSQGAIGGQRETRHQKMQRLGVGKLADALAFGSYFW